MTTVVHESYGAPEGSCEADHVEQLGVCVVCGEWLPTASCREKTCTWVSGRGEDTLVTSVRHHVDTSHPVRVYTG